VEASNVNVVQEMVDMIETQRAYEMNSKAVQTTDQMLQYAAQNMKSIRKIYISFCLVLFGVLLLAALGGCASVQKKPPKEDDQLSWAMQPEPPASNGAIYQVGRDVA